MKLKFAIAAIIILSSTACVTSTNTYTRDIVYRDGSYYSPADQQYGDYYYEPEPDYAYYDDYPYYGFNSGYFGNSWSSRHGSYRCRFSYYYDRYCDSGRNSSYLNFGGLTIFFGSSHHYGYDYGYNYGHGYGYPYYGYNGGYPYYGGYTPRPRPHSNEPLPMPKPRPVLGTPDYGFSGVPGMRVSGEPVLIQTKPGRVDQNPVEPMIEPETQMERNPYTRTRQPRPNIRPEIWRNAGEDNANNEGIVIGNSRQPRPFVRDNEQERAPGVVIRSKPALVTDEDNYLPVEKPIRQDRRLQPYPRDNSSGPQRQEVRVIDNSDSVPASRQPQERQERQERPAPRFEPRERAERVERSENPRPAVHQESNEEGSGAD